jgi:hypothetical protein
LTTGGLGEDVSEMANDDRPRWGRGWLVGLAVLVIGLIAALATLSNDSGSSSAADGAPEATVDSANTGDPSAGTDTEASVSEDADEGDEAIPEQAACSFIRRMSTLTIDGDLATTLAGVGAEVVVVAPATGSVARGIALPIVTSRKITCGDYGRVIGHRGGIELDLGTSSIELRRFRITTADGGVQVFTDPTTDSGVTAFVADLNAAIEPNLDGVITLRRVPLTVTAEGAAVLNAALGTTAFAEGASLGLLDIR